MFASIWKQYFPPKPTFTASDVQSGSQVGKVFILTGANQGIGFELVKLLYPAGATIYLAGRSEERVKKAIQDVIESHKPEPATPATLKYLHLDLEDLMTIKDSALSFASQEKKLDILWNNAGIGGWPKGTTTKQGIEGHIGINCVAPLLFTQELLPQLQEAAKTGAEGSVRVVWTGSLITEVHAPPGGIDFELIESGETVYPMRDYAMSKVGNHYLAVEAAQRWSKYGIVSICQNPGNVYTNAYSKQPWWLMLFLGLLLYEPKLGACTMLYSGFTPDVGMEKNNGCYIKPFGHVEPNGHQGIYKSIADGDAAKFWEWCEKKYMPYLMRSITIS